MEEALQDERFSHIRSDPRFRRIPKHIKKTKVDKRFKKLIKSKNFSQNCTVDERGCPLNLNPSENLEKLYNLDENCSDNETEKSKISPILKKSSKKKTLKTETKVLSDSEDRAITSSDYKKDSNKNKALKRKPIDKSKSAMLNLDLQHKHDSKISVKTLKQNKNVKPEQNVISDTRFLQNSDSEGELSNSDTENSEISSEAESEEEKSESSSEDESEASDSEDSDEEKSDSFDHEWEEQHVKAPDTDDITRRLAVCNMDWDRIRAVDLFAVFNSFKPPDSSIQSVTIYPSEYGLKRMEEEKLKGPSELVEKTLDPDEEEIEDKKGGKYHREKLRQYQMNRLKYFYAVVECDTPETANTLYEQLNGMEYESSSVRFDLRFIPDDMTFDQEPSSTANNSSELTEYKPKLFVTTALQQVNVGLTWDETDHRRRETLQKAFTEPDSIENDIKEYLASSSEEDSEGEDAAKETENGLKISTKDRIEKYKSLLQSLNEEEKEKHEEKYDMEITWETGAKEKAENLVKEKIDEKTITPFEELQKKKREKQKLKKKEKKLSKNNVDNSDNSNSSDSSSDEITERKRDKKKSITDELHLISDSKKLDDGDSISLKKKKKKNKVKQETVEEAEIINDPRFSAIYTSPLYNIDPSHPNFKNTPGNLAIIAEKQRRLKNKAKSDERSFKKLKYN